MASLPQLTVDLWTDGANSGPQKAGGWAAIIVMEGASKLAISGHEPHTTSNRMELTAVVKGLEAVGDPACVTIWTDSAYVKNAHTQGWLAGWKKNGWISSRGDAVANRDLWEELCQQVARHVVKWRKVKGHSTSVLNNAVDALAVSAKQTGQGVTTLLP